MPWRSVRGYHQKDCWIVDLPSLQSMILDSHAFQGDDSEDRKTTSTAPFNYKNTLTMRSMVIWRNEWIDLPSLTEFRANAANFEYMGTVTIESRVSFHWQRIDVPRLLASGITINYQYCFKFTYSIQSTSNYLYSSLIIWCGSRSED